MPNIFLNADCMDPEVGLPSYPDNHFDLAIVDPPYGIGASRPSKKPCAVRQSNGTVLKTVCNDYQQKDWDFETPKAAYFDQLKRVSKNQLVWGANYQDYDLRGGRLVWDKINGLTDQYDCEIAYLSWTKRTELVYYLWSGMMQGVKASRDIKIAFRQRGNKKTNESRIHPTQKPSILYKWILDNYAQPNDLILDTHVGSASSLIACESMGFNYVGYELDPDYYAAAQNRMSKGIQLQML
jgi:site-specific DNA-methyltransferase (adenine-specific)